MHLLLIPNTLETSSTLGPSLSTMRSRATVSHKRLIFHQLRVSIEQIQAPIVFTEYTHGRIPVSNDVYYTFALVPITGIFESRRSTFVFLFLPPYTDFIPQGDDMVLKNESSPTNDTAPRRDFTDADPGDQDDTNDVELVTRGASKEQSDERESLLPPSDMEDLDEENLEARPKVVYSGVPNPTHLPSKALRQTLFGLKRDKTSSGRNKEKELGDAQSFPTFDYTKKYPRDKRYEELHNDARVWLTYNDEAAIFDADMVGEAADSLDILLVFAGLFSAILTTFVAQTSQSLSPDNPAITVSLLVELIAVQRAAVTGASLSDIAAADVAPAIDRTSIWVNALWFTSLALSLASALLAVLSKQWLRQYISFISGSARERALIRQFRYDGMEKWAVRTIVGLLPTILHLSLGLFLIGLVVFLAPLQRGIAISVGIISAALFIAYVSSIIIAVAHVQSPYRTTFSDILSTSLRWLANTADSILHNDNAEWETPQLLLAPTARAAEQTSAVCLDEDVGANQACHALLWLHNTTGSVSAKTLIMESLGSFPPKFFDAKEDTFVQLSNGLHPTVRSSVTRWGENFPKSSADDWERMLRILCFTQRPNRMEFEGDYYPDISVSSIRHHLESDIGLKMVREIYKSSWSHEFSRASSPLPAHTIKLQYFLFSFPGLVPSILDRLPPDFDHSKKSYVSFFEVLGDAPPLVWSALVRRNGWLDQLSPDQLDDWPGHIVLADYLDLVNAALSHRPKRSTVFQNPVSFLTFIHPVFEDLGWYYVHPYQPDKASIHNSVKPLFSPIGSEYDGMEETADPPPADEAYQWDSSVYPEAVPRRRRAHAWALAWRAAEVQYDLRDAWANEEAEASRGVWRERIVQFVRERFSGRARRDGALDKRVGWGNESIEMDMMESQLEESEIWSDTEDSRD